MVNQLEVLKLKKKHLKENHNLKQECLDEDIRSTRIKLNKQFRKEYNFVIFDVLMVFLLLFNVGAFCLTNALVVKASVVYEIPLEYKEANPMTAQVYDFVPLVEIKTETWKMKFQSVMASMMNFIIHIKQFLVWGLMIVVYLYGRFHVTDYSDLRFLGLVLTFGVVLGMYDFFSDYGYFLGKMLWGA